MSTRPLKLAVIGLGMASKPHLAALRQLSTSVEVAGVYARDPERRSEVAAEWGWPEAESLDVICNNPDIDGAIVITPPNARLEIVRALAYSDKHILMEKPIERTLDRAREIVKICEERNVKLGIVFQHRFRAGAKAMTDLVQSGKLGDLHMVRATVPWWREQSYYDQPGRGSYAVDGGGVLLTQAIHVIDLMLSFAGSVNEVIALTGTTGLHKMESEDFATVGLRFNNGAIGSIVATTASYPGYAETLELDFKNASLRLISGELTVNWHDGRIEKAGEVTSTGGGSDPMDFPCDWHRDLIEDFVQNIHKNSEPLVTGKAALEVHLLINAIEQSAQKGCKITMGARYD